MFTFVTFDGVVALTVVLLLVVFWDTEAFWVLEVFVETFVFVVFCELEVFSVAFVFVPFAVKLVATVWLAGVEVLVFT